MSYLIMTNEVTKTEYLKRYLESEKDHERKLKKTKLKPHVSRLKILHENIDIKSIKFGEKIVDDEDEAPVVAEVIDERPMELKVKEMYESSRWKKLDQNESLLCANSNKVENHKNKNNDSDISLPRCAKDKDTSPNYLGHHSGKKERKRHDSDSDISPARSYEIHRSDNKRHDSDSDMSPPRSYEVHKPVSMRHNSDSDISPPRRSEMYKSNRKRDDPICDSAVSNDKLKSRLNIGHEANSSNVLKVKNFHKSSDKSGGRCAIKNRVSSPSILSKECTQSRFRHDSDSDLSPDRNRCKSTEIMSKTKTSSNRNNSDSDLSPPRSGTSSNPKNAKVKGEKSRPDKTLSGLSAGLQSAAVLKRETENLRERERKQIDELHEDISGKNADTILRDRKTGLKRNVEKEMQAKDEELKKAAEHQQKYARWGKGIEQTENKINKFCDDVYEMSKPFARYCDDDDLEERLKSIIHDDDPMSGYMKKKKKQKAPNVPVYSGPPAPPNRFAITPGYRWDGVDRSNGFEKRYFEKHNTTKAVQEEAYLWSVQNM